MISSEDFKRRFSEDLHRLNILSSNIESIALFEKNFYEKVGLKKDWIYYNNMYSDEILYQKIIKK